MKKLIKAIAMNRERKPGVHFVFVSECMDYLFLALGYWDGFI